MTKDELVNKLKIVYGEQHINYNAENNNIYYDEYEIIFSDSLLIDYDNAEGNFIIKKSDYYEILVKETNSSIIFNCNESISNNNITIEINDFSDKMAFLIFKSIPEEKLNHFLFQHRIERHLTPENKITFTDLIRLSFNGHLKSIKIRILNNEYDNIDCLNLSYSFIFALSLRKNINVIIIDSNETFKNICKPILRRLNRGQVDMPYKYFNKDLVQYYISGNASNDSRIKFLSFYNDLEYFFDKMFIDDRCEKIQTIITNPNFNHSNLECYKEILDKLEIKRNKNYEMGSINEKESLLILLKKYINIDEFKKFLSKNEFYQLNNAYKIRKTTKISLSDSDNDIYTKIRDRIYLVRNAIVHSKDGEEIKYLPQKDDKYIEYEIALIKYLAEQIIINTGALI